MKKGLICGTCNYIAINGVAPETCPVCHSPKEVFSEKDIIKTAEDEGATEKHVPVIKIIKTCGLIGEGCTDVHVKIGEVPHPMEQEHYIVFVDLYVDKEYVERVSLTPKLNPAVCAHLKASSGKLTAIEFCNQHGHWINEADI